MHHKKPTLLPPMILASGLFLVACSTSGNTPITNDWSDVTGKSWQLVSLMDGTKTLTPDASIEASATFSETGNVSGSSGCNNYVGGYTRDAANLTFAPLAGTRKMCMTDAMEIESAFNRATSLVAGWTMDKGDLVLTDTSGKAVMTFATTVP